MVGLTDCIVWSGQMQNNGYGAAYCPKRKTTRGAHRKAWEDHTGNVIPEGMVVMHICDNRACVNPDHLLLGTQSENLKDMYAKGRQGTRPHKLSEEQVRDIRARGRPGLYASLGREFGVSRVHVRDICRGVWWSHL